MTITERQVTHKFTNADGTPASGTLTFSLSQRITNSGETRLPGDVLASLDPSGNLTVTLAANDDAGTAPEGSRWSVSARIAGSEADTYSITVPSGSGGVDLGDLLPEQTQVT